MAANQLAGEGAPIVSRVNREAEIMFVFPQIDDPTPSQPSPTISSFAIQGERDEIVGRSKEL